jgi:predicted phosphodiesterase
VNNVDSAKAEEVEKRYNKVVKVAVIADIHSNLEALEAILADAKNLKETWCLGDVVGYGPNPNECCEIIKERAKHCVAGNHDRGVLGKIEISWFNTWAIEAIKVTRKILEEKNKNFLENLTTIKKLGEIVLVHGSVKNPLTDYIFETHQAEENFSSFGERICFVGHTHYPVIFVKENGIVEIVPHFQKKIKFKKDCRYIINPGAVGQPRDGDWRASYGIFDNQSLTFEWKRVEYPVKKTQEKMKQLGLPQFLIQRLSLGR